MRIRYALDTSVYPQSVLTRDSGSWRDQSDANRASGARVEGFVPLSVLTQRLSVASTTAGDAGDAACGCADTNDATAGATTGSASADPGAARQATASDRSVLLGFDAAPLGEPVNILLLVEEQPHDGFAPLTVEALVKDRFEPLTASDRTRALGESGIVSMLFPVKPGARDLFGRTLSWVRLRPSRIHRMRVAADHPRRLSECDMRQRHRDIDARAAGLFRRPPIAHGAVARPPLLADTLELRVREPLDDEERQAVLSCLAPIRRPA